VGGGVAMTTFSPSPVSLDKGWWPTCSWQPHVEPQNNCIYGIARAILRRVITGSYDFGVGD